MFQKLVRNKSSSQLCGGFRSEVDAMAKLEGLDGFIVLQELQHIRVSVSVESAKCKRLKRGMVVY